jgi:hypothetical protein
MRKMGGFGVGIENWHLDRAKNFAIAHMHTIGAMVMKLQSAATGPVMAPNPPDTR